MTTESVCAGSGRFNTGSGTITERFTRLVPYATSGWTGYIRGVRDALYDARRSARAGDTQGRDYWLSVAEGCAERYAPAMDAHITFRNFDGRIITSDETFSDEWARVATVTHTFDVSGV